MEALTNRQLIKEFNKFLRENNCASKFYVNRVKQKKESVSKMLTKVKPILWADIAFTWKRTPQGHDYWGNIDLKWERRLKEIGHKS